MDDINFNEQWLSVKNYEGLYEISNMGRIRTYYNQGRKKIDIRPRLVDPYINRYGYKRIMFYAKHKGFKPANKAICRMVLETFIGNCPIGMEASHLDGIRSNDKLDNLIWETHLENEQRKTRQGTRPIGENSKLAKLKEKEVIEIRRLYSLGGISMYKLAKNYKVSKKTVMCVIKRETWKHVLPVI
jgi:hypothetical protein